MVRKSARSSKAGEADTRQRILLAASEVFAATGYAGARVDDIAERAAVNKAMLYYYVGDKEQLYSMVLSDTIEHALTSLRAAAAEVDTPAEKLRCVFDTFASFGSKNPWFVPVVLREIASGGEHLPDETLLRMTAVFRTVSDVLAEGVNAGDFRPTEPLLTHLSIVGSMMFLIASQPIRRRVAEISGITSPLSMKDVAELTADLFLEGIRREPARARKKAATTKKKALPRAARSKRSRR